MKLKNYAVFEISGLNYEALLNKLIKYNISTIDIKRTTENKLILTTENKNVKKLIAVTNGSCYNIKRIKNYGAKSTFNHFLTHIGVFVALVVSILLMVVNSQFISSVNITGLNKIEKSAIQEVLKQNKAGVFSSINSINTSSIETALLTKFKDLSIASVCVKGTTLQVNVKERIYVDILDGDAYNLIAPNNCIITGLTVTQGTALYKVGDSVKAGDVIVAGYKLNEQGEQVPLKAVANVEVNCFISSKVEVGNTKTELKRTGNKVTKNFYYFNNKKLFNNNFNCKFQFFETEEKTTSMFNLLPFYVKSVTYYECETVNIPVNFEEQKETLKKQLQYETYEKIAETDEIIAENFYITEKNNFNVIIFTLTLKKTLK